MRQSNLQYFVSQYTEPQKVQAEGIYPYFRILKSGQYPLVEYDGRQILMFGSNSYLGLTNHPRIKEAAKKAIDKYSTVQQGHVF